MPRARAARIRRRMSPLSPCSKCRRSGPSRCPCDADRRHRPWGRHRRSPHRLQRIRLRRLLPGRCLSCSAELVPLRILIELWNLDRAVTHRTRRYEAQYCKASNKKRKTYSDGERRGFDAPIRGHDSLFPNPKQSEALKCLEGHSSHQRLVQSDSWNDKAS
jgi:hypothetical protein